MRKALIAAALLAALATQARAWDVKLEVKELWGKSGHRFVSGGVPLLAGQAKEPSELRLAAKDQAGQLVAVPAQFRVLARWWRGDNSIRWVLVDLAASPGAGTVVEDTYGQKYTGAAGEARSRQFRDVRGYRIEEQDPFGFKDWLAFRGANISEDCLERPPRRSRKSWPPTSRSSANRR
ncbi:MAG: hypothetical protein PHU85_17710 [Phycisphaerae bacterium]|nr:hypothetical protein [Phycisphaerae bacterium]